MADILLPHDHGQGIRSVLEYIPRTESFQIVSDIFKQLCDGNRIRIFWMLCHCEECVINISSAMNMSSPAVSHHLKQLKTYGLILSRRDGKEVYYRAADTEQAQLLHKMIEKMVEIACPSGTEDSGSSEQEDGVYVSQKAELIKEIRGFLVQHPERRFTIEELSKKYLINTSTLKSVFKAVYGMPIAAYMKDHRMHLAAELLRTTDDSIAAVAEKVGYETQGKFTKAFKDIMQQLPTEYRRQHRK